MTSEFTKQFAKQLSQLQAFQPTQQTLKEFLCLCVQGIFSANLLPSEFIKQFIKPQVF